MGKGTSTRTNLGRATHAKLGTSRGIYTSSGQALAPKYLSQIRGCLLHAPSLFYLILDILCTNILCMPICKDSPITFEVQTLKTAGQVYLNPMFAAR